MKAKNMPRDEAQEESIQLNTSFDRILGQRGIKNHLYAALRANSVSHAYIISGEKGSGKLKLATAFAAAMLCEDHAERPECACGKCRMCIQVQNGTNPDLSVLNLGKDMSKKKTASISIDEVREQMLQSIHIRPYHGRAKVYIVPDAQNLTQQAQNAILKSIEEPPPYVRIMLLTDNTEKLLQTIRSRCVELSMKAVPDSLMRQFLMKEYRVPDYRTSAILSFAQGNEGRAREYAAGDAFLDKVRYVAKLLGAIRDLPSYEWVAEAAQLAADKAAVRDYLGLFTSWYRDLYLLKSGGDRKYLIYSEYGEKIQAESERVSYGYIQRSVSAVERAEEQLDRNVAPELVLDNLFAVFSGISEGIP